VLPELPVPAGGDASSCLPSVVMLLFLTRASRRCGTPRRTDVGSGRLEPKARQQVCDGLVEGRELPLGRAVEQHELASGLAQDDQSCQLTPLDVDGLVTTRDGGQDDARAAGALSRWGCQGINDSDVQGDPGETADRHGCGVLH